MAWGPVNVPFSEEKFYKIYQMVLDYLEQQEELFVFDGYVGADPEHRMPLRVVNQYAWQNLFARQLFIRPLREDLESHQPQFTVIAVPGLQAVPERDGTNSEAFVIVSFKERVVLIGGTAYAGNEKVDFHCDELPLALQASYPCTAQQTLAKTDALPCFSGCLALANHSLR